MFGFPVNLQDSGVQKFTNDADSGFPKIQQMEIFYSVKDGSWSDSTTWQTASGRVGKLPGQFDDVYVRHSVSVVDTTTINNCYISKELFFAAGSRTLTINRNLFVSGILSLNGNNTSVIVFGSINCIGTLSMTGNSSLLRLYSEFNYINPDLFVPGVGDIQYNRVGNQPILPLSYNRLSINGSGTKPLSKDTTILSNLSVDSNNGFGVSTELQLIFDLGDYDFSVNGTTLIANSATIVRPTSKSILFVGVVAFQGGGLGNNIFGSFNFFGNPNVEFRGGISNNNANVILNTGTGTFSFTTNNQTIATSSSNVIFGCKMSIANGIILTITGTGGIGLNDFINGSNSLSKLTNSSTINFRTQTAAENSMTTGIVDFTTNTNTIGYTGNYTATIPSYFPTFHNLTISGTGTKTLSVNTTLNGNLSVSSSGNLQLSTYNFVVTGTTSLAQPAGIYPLQKSGSGNVTFIGNVISNTTDGWMLDFSSGNPNVEFRNGISPRRTPLIGLKTGTGTWTFTTNNQSILENADSSIINCDCQVIISGAISLTLGNNIQNFEFRINNSLNGNNASSTLINKTYLVNYTNTLLMSTGVLDITTFTSSVIGFLYSGNMNIPYTTFQGLTIGGTGIKSAIGNIICNNTLRCNGGSFELGTYNLTCNASMLNGGGILTKSGSGNVLFVGLLQPSVGLPLLDFSVGNPNVECRGGINLNRSGNSGGFKPGTGTYTFSTNNQNLYDGAGSVTSITFNNIVISGAITLNNSGFPLVIDGVLNGDNANSKFLMGVVTGGVGTRVTYRNATQPMVTGILDTSTNDNTWVYGNANQDIKGGPTTLAKQVYRNLTLNGGGTKTLQGYVSVLNTYTLTSPATLNNNGYTLTNP
jgi:hypothetical protein